MIMHDPPRSKKADILNALTQMLERPRMARITTAGLARQLNQSEAALYRHFASKTQMFEDLIDSIRLQLQEDLAHIEHTEPNGRQRLRKQAHTLLLFTERHRGLTRVLTGDALIAEDPSLLERVSELRTNLQEIFLQNAQLAVQQKTLSDQPSPAVRAGALMDWLLGRWLRYSQSEWTTTPTEDYAEGLGLMGL